jgi:phosphoglycerate dehydrogenase-like enzyme
MIGADELSSMKSGAYLINVARGELVDESALADALRDRLIAGAATDVFAEEPPGEADPLLQAKDSNILFSPHIAGVSGESARRIMIMAAENIGRALAGQNPLYVVNR